MTSCVQVLIIMGVSGAGKTTVGKQLAQQLQWAFIDADDLHPPANVEKMSKGIPLQDDDRWPWLHAVREAAKHASPCVVACSALKACYRDIITKDVNGIEFVMLMGDVELLKKRLTERQGHFAGVGLLDSQLATLETPAEAWHYNVDQAVDVIVDDIVARVRITNGSENT